MSFLSKLTSLFQDNKSLKNGGEKMMNGQAGGSTSTWSKQCSIPSVEITDSPIHRRIQKATSVGSISGLSEDSRSLEDGRASSSGSGKGEVVKHYQQQQQREELGEGVTFDHRFGLVYGT